MSHQRFRFLLQSGVWHLFFLLRHSCLVQHVLSPQMHGHITVSFFIQKASSDCRSCFSPPHAFFFHCLCLFLSISSLCFLPVFFLFSLLHSPLSRSSLCAAFKPGARRTFPGGFPTQRQSHKPHQCQYGRGSRSPQPGQSHNWSHRAHPLRHQSREPALPT